MSTRIAIRETAGRREAVLSCRHGQTVAELPGRRVRVTQVLEAIRIEHMLTCSSCARLADAGRGATSWLTTGPSPQPTWTWWGGFALGRQVDELEGVVRLSAAGIVFATVPLRQGLLPVRQTAAPPRRYDA